MNASCIICADLFTPKSEIYSTGCGHLFHQECLKQWIERSKTCPQCRHKETTTTIHRIYLNFASAEGIAEDVVSLQAKLDTVKFEVSVKEKDVAKYSEKYKACKAKCTRMREAIVEMEQEQREHESSMLALEYQLKSYKDKVQNKDKLMAEIAQLKNQIESMDHLKTVIANCDQQVSQMLNLNNDPDSLGILGITLKRQLEDIKEKSQSMSTQIYRIGKEMLATNGTIQKLKARNEQAKDDLKAHENCSSEINYLTHKIREKSKRRSSSLGNSTITSSSFNNESDSSNSQLLSTPTQKSSYNVSSYTQELPSISSDSRDFTTINLDISAQPSPNNAEECIQAETVKKRSPVIPSGGVKRVKSASSFTSANKFRKLAPGSARKPL